MSLNANAPSADLSGELDRSGAAVRPSDVRPHLPARHRFACLHVVATFCLLAFGASVTSNDAGLAVPDWPTTYGDLNPIAPYLRGLVSGLIALEHNHRVFGMVVGLLTIVLAAWLWRTGETTTRRRLGAWLLVLVCVQGGLGGLTVHMKLPAAVSIAHGMLAQTFFCLSIVTAWLLSREARDAGEARRSGAPLAAPPALAKAARFAFAVIYLQLFFGALVRHTVAKSRVPTFGDSAVVLHMCFALVVLIAIGRLVATTSSVERLDGRLLRPVFALAGLVFLQLLLGLLAVATRTDPLVTVLHVITGAALLGTSCFVVVRTRALAATAAGESAAGTAA